MRGNVNRTGKSTRPQELPTGASYLSNQPLHHRNHQLPTHRIDLHILAVLNPTIQNLHGQQVGGLCGIIVRKRRRSMNQLTIELPESLYQDLEELAQDSGTSLSNYVVHALNQAVVGEKLSARGVSLSQFERTPLKQVIQEHEEFLRRKKQWGKKLTDEEFDAFLDAREPVEPEPDLDPKAAAYLKEQIALARARRRTMAE